MTINFESSRITVNLARQLIVRQFPEYSHLPIVSVEKQGHDNRTYRLGRDMLIRLPTAEAYAIKVQKEQELLPQLAKRLSISIPAPIKMGKPSRDFPYPFSIYKWLPGKSINLLMVTEQEQLAYDLAKFLKELQAITDIEGPEPGQHNWWRGCNVSVYDKGARDQIAKLANIIDITRALALWDKAYATKWNKAPVWIHGDFASGNILMRDKKLVGVIDFGGMGVGDPACDLVVAWTFLNCKAREIFMAEMALDEDTWMRTKAWVLWKATFELCQMSDQNSPEYSKQKRIILDLY